MEVIDRQLLAPCGMNCAICSRYLAQKNNLPIERGKISHCLGCRPRHKQCAFIKRCKYRSEMQSGAIEFCFECDVFPCESLKKLDNRYQKNYEMSMIENLVEIKEKEVSIFLENQSKKYQCPKCGALKSIHNKKCFNCDTILNWRK